MTHKTTTQTSYEATAEEFTRNVADMAPMESIKKFIKLLPSKAKIIDIGCGSGRDARIFTEQGLDVLGIDFSQNLLEIAKSHAPLAKFQALDIEIDPLPASTFDGAWAGCTLCHIPKNSLPSVLKNIHNSLKSSGYFYLTLKKGESEGLEKDLRYSEKIEKYWSYYSENELTERLQEAKFEVIECCTVEKTMSYQTHPCIRIFCKKNTSS